MMQEQSFLKPIVNKKMKKEDPFEYYLLKKVGKTIKKYGMIERGDKILVGVSGGKDSLSLLKILNDRKGFYPNSYEFLALHIVSNLACDGLMNPDIIKKYFTDNCYPFRIVEMKIDVGKKGLSSFWCSWNRRRVLFEMANRWGYNKIALGHHRNDVIETLLLNIFYQAELSTMLPVQRLFNGKITIIRPLYNIPESDTRKFSRLYNFPAVHCRCPIEKETKREMFKRIVNEIERNHPKAGVNALRSLENINEEYLPGVVVVDDVVV
ncbi:MAG: tRNA 2-thiocytidine(32) synthetase TtcA [Spirochaetes bacterium]|nr:tRNA 2-thiocytidine(32) synthetase TtcA [Spirochaetota bacterium]